MPIIPEIISACDEIKKLHKLKNDDYALYENPFYNFDVQEYFIRQVNDERDKVFASLIGLKFARLCNLINKQGQPNNESIEDTFLDLAVYTLLWRADKIRNGRRLKIVESELDRKIEQLNTK